MIDLPEFSTFEEEIEYISGKIPVLLNDAVDEFNSGNRSKELLDRFRKLRPYEHEVAQYHINEIEKGDDLNECSA